MNAETATTGPIGSFVVKASLLLPAGVRSMGISTPALWAISDAQVSTPSMALATSTLASISGFPPSAAISIASSSLRPTMISAAFFRMAIRSCFGSPLRFASCVFAAVASAVSTSRSEDSAISPTGEPSKGLVTTIRSIINSPHTIGSWSVRSVINSLTFWE